MSMILITLAVAAISMTVTRSTLFTPLRKWRFFQCPYCFSHWVAFALVGLTRPVSLFDFVINSFAVIAASVIPMICIEYLNTMVDRHVKLSTYS